MRRNLSLVLVTALGLAAATGYTAKPANAWDIHALPPAFHVSHTMTNVGNCSPYYTIIYIKGDGTGAVSPDLCDNSPTFQQDLDAFVDSPCTVAGATCVPPPPVTTTAPPATTTTDAAPADLAPVTTATETTATPTAAPDAPTTVTVTVTDPTVDAKLAALQAQLDALSHRVDAIAQANTAAWTAFVDAIGTGASAADAALAARSAGLNAIYGL